MARCELVVRKTHVGVVELGDEKGKINYLIDSLHEAKVIDKQTEMIGHLLN